MAHHIRIGEVEHDQRIFAGADQPRCFPGHFASGHFRLQVIRRHVARGGNEHTVLARVGLLVPPIKEIGDVSVLLSLGDAKLVQPEFADDFGEDFCEPHRRKGHWVCEGLIVRGHGGKSGEFGNDIPGKAIERGLGQGAGQFPCPIGSKVIENRAVTIADRASGQAVLTSDDRRSYKLIRDLGLVTLGDRLFRGCPAFPDAFDYRGIGFRNAVPPLVPVHRVVPAHDGGDRADGLLAHFRFDIADISKAALRRCVSPIEKRVNEGG